MGSIIRQILDFIAVIHINAFITLKYFLINSIWIIIASLGLIYLIYVQLEDIEDSTIKPKRKRL
ncbi:MAG: hypothetical protein ACOCRX_04505 [Candidatus Woesearchaeota archaeon]